MRKKFPFPISLLAVAAVVLSFLAQIARGECPVP